MTTSTPSKAASSSWAAAREVPWWTTTSEVGGEAGRLPGPVARHRRGDDDQRGPVALGPAQVGEHGGGLAQAHVEGQAAAQLGGVEVAQPGQGLGLVAAQLALEPGGPGDRVGGDQAGLVEQVGGPAAALHRQAAGQGGALQAHRVAEDLGPGELGGVGPLGQRGRRLLEVGPVELDPPPVGADQRSGLGGQARDLGRGELDVVEQGGPADVAELVGADDGVAGGLGEHLQPGRGLAAGERRHPHVEPGGLQGGAGDGHQLPGLVLAEVHLAPAQGPGAEQGGEDALQAGQLVGQGLGVLAVDQGDLDGQEPALGPHPEHGEEPGVALVGRVELHDQGGPVGVDDRLGPALEALGHLGPGGHGCGEGGAVEPGDHRLGHVHGVAGGGRGRLQLQEGRGLGHDGVDRGGQHAVGDGAGVGVAQGDDRAGHGLGQRLDLGLVDQGGHPADVEVHGGALAAALAAQVGDDAALGDQAHRGHGDPAQPGDAEAEALAAQPAAHGDHPPQRVGQRDGDRLGVDAAREAHAGVHGPPVGGGAGGLDAVGQLGVAGGGHPRTAGPQHQLARRPRRLEPHLAGGVGHQTGGGRHLDPGHEVEGGLQQGQVGLEVGDHQRALVALQLAGGVEAVVGVVDEALDQPAVLARARPRARPAAARLLALPRQPRRRPRRLLWRLPLRCGAPCADPRPCAGRRQRCAPVSGRPTTCVAPPPREVGLRRSTTLPHGPGHRGDQGGVTPVILGSVAGPEPWVGPTRRGETGPSAPVRATEDHPT